MPPWRVVAAGVLGRVAAMVVAALPATVAHPALAVDITGTWAVCLSRLGHEPLCPFALTGTLVGTGDEFTLTLTQVGSCTTTGTVDPDTGIMTRTGGCAPELVGSATDTALSGTMSLVVCSYRFDGVRPCEACDDGIACTVDGCGHTACSVSSLSPRIRLR